MKKHLNSYNRSTIGVAAIPFVKDPDKRFSVVLWAAALVVPLICVAMLMSLISDSVLAFDEFGILKFITSSQWNYTEGHESYGALPFIVGTLESTFLALLICIPFSLTVAAKWPSSSAQSPTCWLAYLPSSMVCGVFMFCDL